jgi:catechol 2,3-dioxygenase-like lactoylglutathione lyase family enzyme
MESTLAYLIDLYDAGKLTRRQLVASLVATAGMGSVTGKAEAATGPTFQATRLNHLALSVTDVARSRDFYVRHLGLRVTSDSAPHNCFLDCGQNFVALFRGEEAGMHHYCYSIADFDTEEVAVGLREVGLEPDIQGRRIYFPDPDGLTVQLASESHGA